MKITPDQLADSIEAVAEADQHFTLSPATRPEPLQEAEIELLVAGDPEDIARLLQAIQAVVQASCVEFRGIAAEGFGLAYGGADDLGWVPNKEGD